MPRVMSERADAVLALAGVFRTYGYGGASLAAISQNTGLGKGSLYNFFPGGKEEMAQAVLDQVATWFEHEVYGPLRSPDRPGPERITAMIATVEAYFTSRQLVCLFGAFALGQERERFAARIRSYFADWITALQAAFPEGTEDAGELATDLVASIQGALVLARALDDPDVLKGTIARSHSALVDRLSSSSGSGAAARRSRAPR
jgi:AcrR family transcriptional regulator